MRAVTDADGEVRADEEAKPGVTNLLRIYSALAGEPVAEPGAAIRRRRATETFKKDLAEVVVDAFAPIRERTEKLLADEAELDRLLAAGAAKAHELAARHDGAGAGPDRLPAARREPARRTCSPGRPPRDRAGRRESAACGQSDIKATILRPGRVRRQWHDAVRGRSRPLPALARCRMNGLCSRSRG